MAPGQLTASAPSGDLSSPASGDAGTAPRERAYRPELQGLRALAVVLVVVYHVWLQRISGGVDVFFVITGFLITGQLVRAVSRGGIRFRPMWGRMIKRLFPAALTVLVAVVGASVLWLPEHRWFQTIREVAASALYLENWQLAADSTDYFAQHNTASVVQHFWSLSIQGQFYVGWPLLIAVAAIAAGKAGWSLRRTLLMVIGAAFVASLAFSIWLTAADQPLAYFHSLTRVWEFALGGLLALLIDRIALSRGLRILLGWLGVAALISCGMVLQVGCVFPGYAALWPTVAAVLVLLAGATGSAVGADRLLSSRPLEFVGNISYSFYLWHWPVLLFYLILRDRVEVGFRGGAVIIACAFTLAVVTYYLVEEPARRSKFGVTTRWGAYRFGVALLVPVLALAGGWQAYSLHQAAKYQVSINDPDYPGAMARTVGYDPPAGFAVEPAPSMIEIPRDLPKLSDVTCSISPRRADLNICRTNHAGPPAKRMVVVGDSHSETYLGALDPLVRKNNWQVFSALRHGCPFSVTSELIKESQACADWNAALAEEMKTMRPDAVITLATYRVKRGLTEHTPPGFVEQWRKLASAGIPVVALRDNPRYDFAPSACAEQFGEQAPRCSGVRAEFYPDVPPYEHIPDVPSTVRFVDLTEFFCLERICPPVIGNVRLYLDDNHLGATYMKTLSPILEERLKTALGW